MLIAAHELDITRATTPVYNGIDSCQTFEINEALEDLSTPESQLAYDVERGMQAIALEMMLRGFRVDPAERERVIINTKKKLGTTRHILGILVKALIDEYDPKFPNSTKQLTEFFYQTLNITPIETHFKGETKRPMDRKTLEKIEQYFYARPFVGGILLHRDLTGTLNVLETEIDSDWRWRCSYNIAGTTTSRWSSSKSTTGTGKNFQNITEELRRIFIPDPGWKLYGIDGEQAEARDVGWYCGTVLGDWSYLDMLEKGDIHTQIARLCWTDLPWTGDLRKDRQIADRRFYRHFSFRDATKRLAHGSTYLGSPWQMAQETKIPLKIVAPFQERFFDQLPCIPRMHQRIATELQTKQYLTNAFGLRRDFFDRPNSDETLKSAIAHMFQSATGNRLNLGLWRGWKHMGTRIQILSQLHDAFYFQARVDDNEQEVCSQVKQLFEIPLYDPKSGRKFIVPGEIQGGFNWAHRWRLDEDGKAIDWNPKGLDKIMVNQ